MKTDLLSKQGWKTKRLVSDLRAWQTEEERQEVEEAEGRLMVSAVVVCIGAMASVVIMLVALIKVVANG